MQPPNWYTAHELSAGSGQQRINRSLLSLPVLQKEVTREGETWRGYLLRVQAQQLNHTESKGVPAWTVSQCHRED